MTESGCSTVLSMLRRPTAVPEAVPLAVGMGERKPMISSLYRRRNHRHPKHWRSDNRHSNHGYPKHRHSHYRLPEYSIPGSETPGRRRYG